MLTFLAFLHLPVALLHGRPSSRGTALVHMSFCIATCTTGRLTSCHIPAPFFTQSGVAARRNILGVDSKPN